MISNNDLIIFFIIGLAGAAIYEVTKIRSLTRVRIENKPIPLKATIPIFLIAGGVVTLFYEMHMGTPFNELNSWKIFAIGFGWQAVLKNYIPSEKAPAKGEPTEIQALSDRLNTLEQERDKERGDRLDQLKKARRPS